MPADTRYKKQYQVSSSKYQDALEARCNSQEAETSAKRTFLFLCVSAPLREENPPRRIGKKEISEGPFYSFVACLQTGRLCTFAREKEYYTRKAAKASGRQELQKLNARDLSLALFF